ncbi:hypothetical protein PV797_08545 [Clostridiaceae bacterium M8S5]|nr:hypothetical protein PV797_08545 [Clostridiaceae bacterium M8S5]
MPIKPIDMQNMIPRAQQLSNMNQTKLNRSKNMANVYINEQDTVADKKMNQVNNTEDTYKTSTNKDGRNKNNSGQSNKKNRKKQQTKNQKETNKLNRDVGRHIDIKI